MQKKVAIYCRVATAKQLETSHLAEQAQQEYLLQVARKRQFEVVAIYSDIGFSGHDLSRPAYTRMIADAKAGNFDTILVKNMKRLYRRSILRFPDFPVQIISVDERIHQHER